MRTTEEVLRGIEERAAMLQQLAFLAAEEPDMVPSTNVWNGVGEVCGEIERHAQRVRKALKLEALSTNVHD